MSFLDTIKRRARPLVCPFDPIIDAIPENSAVFDIGCGSGFLLGLIAEKKSATSLAGVEVDAKLVQLARRYINSKASGRQVFINQYDGIQFPREISKANVILLIDVLHHVSRQDQSTFLRSIHAVMASSAIFILKDIDASRPLLCRANKLHDLIVTGTTGHERTKEETKGMLEVAGFRVKSAGIRRKLWYPHYWFVSIKE